MTTFNPINRADIIRTAKSWIGTPYKHQASVKGAGTDCLGLIRGVWREHYGDEPMPVPPYTMDWGERSKGETLLRAARKCLTPVPLKEARPGDVMLFRMHAKGPCKHIGIMSSGSTFIHAYSGQAVTESFLVPYWQRCWVYSFAYPDLAVKRIRPHRVNDVYPPARFDDSYKQFPAKNPRNRHKQRPRAV